MLLVVLDRTGSSISRRPLPLLPRWKGTFLPTPPSMGFYMSRTGSTESLEKTGRTCFAIAGICDIDVFHDPSVRCSTDLKSWTPFLLPQSGCRVGSKGFSNYFVPFLLRENNILSRTHSSFSPYDLPRIPNTPTRFSLSFRIPGLLWSIKLSTGNHCTIPLSLSPSFPTHTHCSICFINFIINTKWIQFSNGIWLMIQEALINLHFN